MSNKDLITKLENNIGYVSINRPPNNHFDAELIAQIADFLEEMEADSATSQLDTLDSKEIKSVAELARMINSAELTVSDLEDQLKQAKKGLLKLTDEDLPAALQEIGVNKFTLDDGSSVEVKSTYGAHIKNDNKEEASTKEINFEEKDN